MSTGDVKDKRPDTATLHRGLSEVWHRQQLHARDTDLHPALCRYLMEAHGIDAYASKRVVIIGMHANKMDWEQVVASAYLCTHRLGICIFSHGMSRKACSGLIGLPREPGKCVYEIVPFRDPESQVHRHARLIKVPTSTPEAFPAGQLIFGSGEIREVINIDSDRWKKLTGAIQECLGA